MLVTDSLSARVGQALLRNIQKTANISFEPITDEADVIGEINASRQDPGSPGSLDSKVGKTTISLKSSSRTQSDPPT